MKTKDADCGGRGGAGDAAGGALVVAAVAVVAEDVASVATVTPPWGVRRRHWCVLRTGKYATKSVVGRYCMGTEGQWSARNLEMRSAHLRASAMAQAGEMETERAGLKAGPPPEDSGSERR